MILGEIIITEDLMSNALIESIKEKPILKIKTEKTINSEITTMLVGWKETKLFKNLDITILNKTINDNLFWTYSPSENLQDFNEDIPYFIDQLYNDYIRGIKYKFIDPVIDDVKSIIDIVKYSSNDKFDCSYYTDDFIYMFNATDKTIYGIDIKYYNYLKLNINKLIDKLRLSTNNNIIEEYSLEESVYQKYKNYFNHDFDKKYIPYLITGFES